MKIPATFLSALLCAFALLMPASASASRYLQCVPFARQMSGVDIRGNAKTWWAQAAGRYDRGNAPREGAVLTLPGYGKMYNGHVAMVSKVVGVREVLLTHANWSRRGGIERNVRAIDVSAAGDWSRVKIWFAGNGDFGTTSYPAYGFIYNDRPTLATPAAPETIRDRFALSEDVVQLASLEL